MRGGVVFKVLLRKSVYHFISKKHILSPSMLLSQLSPLHLPLSPLCSLVFFNSVMKQKHHPISKKHILSPSMLLSLLSPLHLPLSPLCSLVFFNSVMKQRDKASPPPLHAPSMSVITLIPVYCRKSSSGQNEEAQKNLYEGCVTLLEYNEVVDQRNI